MRRSIGPRDAASGTVDHLRDTFSTPPHPIPPYPTRATNVLKLLEQDRHALRRRLAALQSESDARLLEVQSDLAAVGAALAEREAALRAAEREKQQLSSRAEETLSAQLQCLRDQCNLRKSSLQDHLTSLEVMRDEIQLLSEKKAELERRLQALLRQRDEQAAALDDASDRIFRQSQRELEQLRITNRLLGEQLEQQSASAIGSTTTHRSLLNEMECDGCEDNKSQLHFGIPSDTEIQLQQEVESACRRLRAICIELKSCQQSNDASMASASGMESASNSSTSNDSGYELVKTGRLSDLVDELCSLIKAGKGHSRTSSTSSGIGLELELEAELHRAREALERSERALEELQDQFKRAQEQVQDLQSKLTVCEAELSGTKEERDRARADMENSHLARDELLRKAWETRDGAVARKNHVEVELARTRIDVMQANSQLLEAIQQKVELSQQLEQWQMDMQLLLDDNMRQKLTTQEQRNVAPTTGTGATTAATTKSTNKPSKRLFGFFQR
ncbi:Bicaudal D-related protein homolog [Gryllus bimaculatus]|nr:Bicaudal D-related protein homolog [Gryllus bimaculatus]